MNAAVLDQYGAVFTALADPHRRMVLQRLLRGKELSASSLATEMPISRQAVLKHLTLLDQAELVKSRRLGREVLFSARPTQLVRTGEALQQIGAAWEETLDQLKHLIEAD